MENIMFAANVVAPLLILMSLGYFAKQKGLLSKATVSQCNAIVFKIFLPVLLFNNLRGSTLSALNEISLFVFVLICVIALFFVVTFVIMLVEKDNAKRGVMIQGIVRSNYALFGIPVIMLLFPESDLALASLLVAVVIPLFNIGAVIVLTCFGSKSTSAKAIALGIVKNPLIIGSFLGIIALVAQVQFPQFVEQSLTDIGSIASPFARFLLGASFEFQQVRSIVRQLSIAVFGRLIALPLITLSLAVALGFRGEALGCVLVVFGSPTAVSSFTMAEAMGGDRDLAAGIVVFTSALSIFSIFVAIFILKIFAFI